MPIHSKVKMSCGLFDDTKPSYHRAKFRQEGPLVATPSNRDRQEITPHSQLVKEELGAIKDRRTFLRSVAAHIPSFDPTPRLTRTERDLKRAIREDMQRRMFQRHPFNAPRIA